MCEVYESLGKNVEQWACFQEVHPLSKHTQEIEIHYHIIVQTDKHCTGRLVFYV